MVDTGLGAKMIARLDEIAERIAGEWWNYNGAYLHVVDDVNCVHLKAVYVPPLDRGERRGHKAMAMLVNIAEEVGAGIVLCPVPFYWSSSFRELVARLDSVTSADMVTDSPRAGEMTWRSLRAWYMRFGFFECPDGVFSLTEYSEEIGRRVLCYAPKQYFKESE